ncbi:MAG: hypothetical protein QM723_26620 [Myxococcaceae bacterium]
MGRLRSVCIVTLLATACLPRASRVDLMEEARGAADAPNASGHVIALAGWRTWLYDGNVEQASKYFDRALVAAPNEPYALYAKIQLAIRDGDPRGALDSALLLLERAPTHPLASAAGRVVFELTGNSTSGDALILEKGAKLLPDAGGQLRGDAAVMLRSALANIHSSRADADEAKTLAAMGAPTFGTLAGPMSAFHNLGLADAFSPEKTGTLDGLEQGPYGAFAKARAIHFADGKLSLAPEPLLGDVYYYAADFDLPEKGEYVVRTVTQMDHVLYLDGTELVARHSWLRPASTLQETAVRLLPGPHRLVVKMARELQQGHLSLQIARLDGKPAPFAFKPAAGAPANWSASAIKVLANEPGLYPEAKLLADALAEDCGPVLSAFIAARDSLARDRDGAKRLIAGFPAKLDSPEVRVLRADEALTDRTLPQKVARGQATRDLEAALAKDPAQVHAWLITAQLALDDTRNPEALEALHRAEAAHSPASVGVLELRARVELALGVDAVADATAKEALTRAPGNCEALQLRYDLARRRDAYADSDAALKDAHLCPGFTAREAEHYRNRGQLAEAAKLWETALSRDENQTTVGTTLAGLYTSLARYDDAKQLLLKQAQMWPRNANLYRQLGDLYEFTGDAKAALDAREHALLLDGSDLTLRRMVARAKTGKDLLADRAITAEDALKAYEAAPGDESAPAAFILDAAAVEAYPDGTVVDRIHVIQKAIDQGGVQQVAEVQIPGGAQVLTLRTLKADGRQLEPEAIENKEGISLPGVQVGDFVEYEYLLAQPPRGMSQPGFTAAAFYYRVAGQPNNWSTYVVLAPKGSGMKVDGHNLEEPAAPPKVQGDKEVFFHEERRVTPYIPEPNGPPSGNEFLPFVVVGAGISGNDGLINAYSDAFIDKGQITFDVEQFAQKAVEGKTGRAAVEAIYSAVMHQLSGRDAGLTVSAAASAAQDRGSRVWLMRSALRAAGFDVRLAAVNTFNTDPAKYLFPNENLLPYVCLRVKWTENEKPQEVWLDPVYRFGPFGDLPESATSRDAVLFPEPGVPLEKVKTPKKVPRPQKEVALTLKLNEDGVLEGEGTETYQGEEAAQLSEALEQVPNDQREQALQTALSRYFGGADLSSLKLDMKREVGATVVVGYGFKAPRFGRKDGDKRLVLSSPVTFPVMLGKRFLQLGLRRTPLFIGDSESSHTLVKLTLPHGWVLRDPLKEAKGDSAWGHFVRRETQDGDVLTVDEDYRLDMARIPPKDYEEFGNWCGSVDVTQGRDLIVEKK